MHIGEQINMGDFFPLHAESTALSSARLGNMRMHHFRNNRNTMIPYKIRMALLYYTRN